MGHTPDTREPQYHVKTRAPPTISLCHCPQNTTAGRVWLYTLLYGNSLYRLYATAIHRYTSFTPRPGSPVTLYSLYSVYSYTAIHAIQHTAPYSLPQAPVSSSPPESAVQPPSGPQARADRRREVPPCGSARGAASCCAQGAAADPAAARRPGYWAALRTPSRVLLAVGSTQHAALLHD